MSVLFTVVVTTRDWRALRERHREVLVKRARLSGALRYQVYRNVHDAAQALIIAELPDDDALRELRHALGEEVGALLAARDADERTWELIGWEEIG